MHPASAKPVPEFLTPRLPGGSVAEHSQLAVGVDQRLDAVPARRAGYVARSHAPAAGLQQRIDFGVDAIASIAQATTAGQAVGHASRPAIVPGADDPVVLVYEHASDLPLVAERALGQDVGQVQHRLERGRPHLLSTAPCATSSLRSSASGDCQPGGFTTSRR